MEFTDALRLMGIEKRCVQRNSLSLCYRQCERCDLVQEDTDLIEAFQMAEFALKKLIEEDKMQKTNADRIRAMSDEELAELFEMIPHSGNPSTYTIDGFCIDDGLRTKRQWLDWLRKEAE